MNDVVILDFLQENPDVMICRTIDLIDETSVWDIDQQSLISNEGDEDAFFATTIGDGDTLRRACKDAIDADPVDFCQEDKDLVDYLERHIERTFNLQHNEGVFLIYIDHLDDNGQEDGYITAVNSDLRECIKQHRDKFGDKDGSEVLQHKIDIDNGVIDE